MEDDLWWKTTSDGRQPLMEDDLKKLKVQNLSNHLLDHIQNLSLVDQTIFYKSLKWRWAPMEENLICKDDLNGVQNVTYEFLGGNKRKTQRKSQVWLCSA